MDRGAIVATLPARLRSEPWILAAWLFGSTARDAAGPRSDVDIAILRGGPRRSG